MKVVKQLVATLLICFLIGGAVAQLLPHAVLAGGLEPPICNTSCADTICTCEPCDLQQGVGTKRYIVYQYRDVVGCDGPYACGLTYLTCGMDCCENGYPVE